MTSAYTIADGWDAWLRMPYDVKRRTARVELVDPATPGEVAAMQRHLELHHPTRTLEGFSDFSLLVAHRRQGVLMGADVLALAIGTSLPVGRTEDDPYQRGDAGLAHEHIQFGTGTFDPLLELYYLAPLAARMSGSVSLIGRAPLYENHKGYRGPAEVSASVSFALAATDRLSLRAGWSSFYQSYAYWDGARDINSGLISNGAVGGLSYRVSQGARLSFDVRVPVSQETLSPDGDTFELGTVAQLGLSYSF